jgi:hypothetical protein
MTKDKELIESLEKQVKELKEQLAKVEGDNAPARSKVFKLKTFEFKLYKLPYEH